jgi:TonB family protein
MLELIRRNWDRPAVGGEIELVVSFRVLADGTVEDLSIVSSSRLRRFDLAGMSAVERASPMPPLPRGFRKPALNVTLIFE